MNSREYWEAKLADAQQRQASSRGRAALRRANADAQEARMALRDKARGESLSCSNDYKE